MTPYPDYKPSGVAWLGDVPAHWDVMRLRFVADVNPPSTVLRRLQLDAEISFVPMDNVGEGGGLRLDTTRLVDEVGSGYTEFQDGDVVVAKITPCFENGKGALAEGLVNGAAYGTTELHVLRPADRMNARFLFLMTVSSAFRSLGEAEMYGAGGQKRVPTEFLQDVPVPVPPVEEQAMIAAWLDGKTAQIDALVAKQEAFVATLREQRAALVTDAVTKGLRGAAADAVGLPPDPPLKPSGVAWLGDVPAHWDVKRLRFLVGFSGGGTPSTAEPKYWDGDIPWVSPKDMKGEMIADTQDHVSEDAVRETATSLVEPGSVLLVVRSGILKHTIPVAINAVPVTLNQDMKALHPSHQIESRYLSMLIRGNQAELLALWSKQGATVESLEHAYIADTPVPVPPVEEQAMIAAWLDGKTAQIDALVSKTEAAIERLREWRAALVTAAVTGQIDVRSGVPLAVSPV